MPDEKEIFDKLFVDRENIPTEEFARKIFVLGLLSYEKWDKLISWKEENNKKSITIHQRCKFADTFTDRELKKIKDATQKTMIELQSDNKGFWYGAWQSMAGGFLFSLFLVLTFFIIKYAGYDAIDLVRLPFAVVGHILA